jgi:hypothetical protein
VVSLTGQQKDQQSSKQSNEAVYIKQVWLVEHNKNANNLFSHLKWNLVEETFILP